MMTIFIAAPGHSALSFVPLAGIDTAEREPQAGHSLMEQHVVH